MQTTTRPGRRVATPEPVQPPAADRGPNARRKLLAFGYLSPTIVLLIVLMATPVAMVIGYSVFDNVITERNPEAVGAANYVEILTDPAFWNAASNTLVFTGASVVVHLILGLTFAMLLNTELIGRRLRAAFRVVLILPWLFTIAIVAVLWRMLLDPHGVVNYLLNIVGLDVGLTDWLGQPTLALLSVTVINIWAGYPFYMVSLLAGLQGIPGELHEAAKVDGANPWQRFWNVTIPQLRPLLISLALLDVIWTSQQFALIWMTTGGGPIDSTEVLSTFTYKLAFSRYEFALASTSAVVILLASLVLAVFYARSQRAKD
ncbi:carbohydrate ABC transporter permease [Puerhibacterium sp. TATVAM-FAB25]|uniref:carbohydrate ABC transporter permease n=1 Tax=Puerhibacterium sp. TATVAM-FAB25 TaxID=3093699 RepID=UPI003979A4C1